MCLCYAYILHFVCLLVLFSLQKQYKQNKMSRYLSDNDILLNVICAAKATLAESEKEKEKLQQQLDIANQLLALSKTALLSLTKENAGYVYCIYLSKINSSKSPVIFFFFLTTTSSIGFCLYLGVNYTWVVLGVWKEKGRKKILFCILFF